jgi:hypothetical protein
MLASTTPCHASLAVTLSAPAPVRFVVVETEVVALYQPVIPSVVVSNVLEAMAVGAG